MSSHVESPRVVSAPWGIAARLRRWPGDVPIDPSRTRVTHTYSWTELGDERRFGRVRATTADKLLASLDRRAALAEQE